MDRRRPTGTLLRALATLVITATAFASMQYDDIPGTYSSVYGSSSCPSTLEVDRQARIQLSSTGCKLSSLMKMTEGNSSNGNGLTTAFSHKKGSIGAFWVGELEEPLVCKDFKSTSGHMNFFSPASDTAIDFKAAFSNAPKSSGNGHGAGKHGHGSDKHDHGSTKHAERFMASHEDNHDLTMPVTVEIPSDTMHAPKGMSHGEEHGTKSREEKHGDTDNAHDKSPVGHMKMPHVEPHKTPKATPKGAHTAHTTQVDSHGADQHVPVEMMAMPTRTPTPESAHAKHDHMHHAAITLDLVDPSASPEEFPSESPEPLAQAHGHAIVKSTHESKKDDKHNVHSSHAKEPETTQMPNSVVPVMAGHSSLPGEHERTAHHEKENVHSPHKTEHNKPHGAGSGSHGASSVAHGAKSVSHGAVSTHGAGHGKEQHAISKDAHSTSKHGKTDTAHGHVSKDHSDETKKHGDDAKEHNDHAKEHDDDANKHGDEAKKHVGASKSHHADPSEHGKESTTHGDHSKKHDTGSHDDSHKKSDSSTHGATDHGSSKKEHKGGKDHGTGTPPGLSDPVIGLLQPGKAFTAKSGKKYMSVGEQCVYVKTKDASCFPGTAMTTLRDGSVVRMDELRVGDEVAVGDGQFSRIFMWTHRDANARASAYIRVSVSGGRSIVAAAGHYVHTSSGQKPIENIIVGDKLLYGSGELASVNDVSFDLNAVGLYNPQTIAGDIVVDGFLATTYTSAVQPRAAHALLAPLRALYAVRVASGSFDALSARLGRVEI